MEIGTIITLFYYSAENNQIVASIQNGQLIREDLTSVAEQWSSFLRLKDRELKDADRQFYGLRLIKETSKAQLYREVLMKSKASRLDQVAIRTSPEISGRVKRDKERKRKLASNVENDGGFSKERSNKPQSIGGKQIENSRRSRGSAVKYRKSQTSARTT